MDQNDDTIKKFIRIDRAGPQSIALCALFAHGIVLDAPAEASGCTAHMSITMKDTHQGTTTSQRSAMISVTYVEDSGRDTVPPAHQRPPSTSCEAFWPQAGTDGCRGCASNGDLEHRFTALPKLTWQAQTEESACIDQQTSLCWGPGLVARSLRHCRTRRSSSNREKIPCSCSQSCRNSAD